MSASSSIRLSTSAGSCCAFSTASLFDESLIGSSLFDGGIRCKGLLLPFDFVDKYDGPFAQSRMINRKNNKITEYKNDFLNNIPVNIQGTAPSLRLQFFLGSANLVPLTYLASSLIMSHSLRCKEHTLEEEQVVYLLWEFSCSISSLGFLKWEAESIGHLAFSALGRGRLVDIQTRNSKTFLI